MTNGLRSLMDCSPAIKRTLCRTDQKLLGYWSGWRTTLNHFKNRIIINSVILKRLKFGSLRRITRIPALCSEGPEHLNILETTLPAEKTVHTKVVEDLQLYVLQFTDINILSRS